MNSGWDYRLEYFKNRDINKVIQNDMIAFSILIPEAIIDFINKYCITYDPRLPESKEIPFVLYDKQKEYIHWLYERLINKQDGIVEKARDVGATWCSIAFFVFLILFHNGFSLGAFSYKQDEVDKTGDISTLIQKARFILTNLPKQFTAEIESRFMYIRNKRTGSDIAGSSGDNPGRGGRRTMFLKDESAFYPHAEMVEASLSETSNCKIDISTHAGTNTIFYNKCLSGALPIFQFDWFDVPGHTKKLFEQKKEQAIANGLLHVFKREIEKNAEASIESVVIPSEWVNAAKKNTHEIRGKRIAALDVADEGFDTNALTIMDGNVILYIDEWGEGDTTETAKKAFWKAVQYNCEEFRYDCIGVGAGIKGATNDIKKQNNLPETAKKMKCIGWAASSSVSRASYKDYYDKPNKELFENAKAQAYWKVREEFRNTYRSLTEKDYDETQLITFKETGNKTLYDKLVRELSQPQHKLSSSGKIIIDKKPNGSKSPNLCDSYVMCRAEIHNIIIQVTAV